VLYTELSIVLHVCVLQRKLEEESWLETNLTCCVSLGYNNFIERLAAYSKKGDYTPSQTQEQRFPPYSAVCLHVCARLLTCVPWDK
jgi:hypothetical protein